MALTPAAARVFAAAGETEARDPGNKWPGRIAINFNGSASDASNTINAEKVATMVDQTIKLLTGKDSVGEAWKSVFPDSLSLTSKIAVKVICYNPYKVGLNWQTVKGVTEGLQKMEFDGTKFPAANITIYELTTSPTANAFNVAGYTAANFPGITISTDKSKKIKAGDGALNDREYAVALKEADFLINCFNTRGHAYGDNDGKFTLGFKSHFGTYTDPSGMHGNPAGSGVSKNIRELTCVGPVFKKHVLSVCGALFGSNEGNGPGGIMGSDDLKPEDFSTYVKTVDSSATAKNPSTIIMSTDPASIEMQAIKIMRINKGKKYGPSDLPAYLQSAAGVDKSGFSPTYNIGIIDESKMDIGKIVNDEIVSAPVGARVPHTRIGSATRFTVTPLHHRRSVLFDITLPAHAIGRTADIEIYTVSGSRVTTLHHAVSGIGSHISWDRCSTNRMPVSAGQYIARITCSTISLSARFILP